MAGLTSTAAGATPLPGRRPRQPACAVHRPYTPPPCSQWNLVDDDTLLYKFLWRFDRAMHALQEGHPWLESTGGQ